MSQQAKQLYDTFLKLSHHFSSNCCSGESCEDFTLIDFLALRCVQTQPHCSVQTVGYALGFTKSGATRVIKRLESRDMISICTSPDDARIKCLSLTEQAEDCMQAASDAKSRQIAQLLKKMGAEDSQKLIDGIQSLMQHLK